jgi:hypothetical protein
MRNATHQTHPSSGPEQPPFPCPGYHNDSWRAEETDDPDHENNPPHHGDPIWCPRCTERLRSALAYMPQLADNLLTEIDDGTGAPAIHRQQAHAFLLDQIRDVLTQWEDETRDARGLTPRPTGVRQVPAIHAAATFLLAHLDWNLTKAPDCYDPAGLTRAFVDRVHRIDRQGMYLTQADEPKPIDCIGVRCRGCGQLGLVRGVDRSGVQSDEVRCENCGRRMTLKEYEDNATQWAIYEYAHLPEWADDAKLAELARPIAAFERSRGIA